ncbi:hypothetical protein G9A89_014774 [Geosiphon pyriformis]|nr:hypothetical protein G9A89_014774 [Geosiphon pyriformis]
MTTEEVNNSDAAVKTKAIKASSMPPTAQFDTATVASNKVATELEEVEQLQTTNSMPATIDTLMESVSDITETVSPVIPNTQNSITINDKPDKFLSVTARGIDEGASFDDDDDDDDDDQDTRTEVEASINNTSTSNNISKSPDSESNSLSDSKEAEESEEALAKKTSIAPNDNIIKPKETIEAHRDSKSRYVKPYPTDELEKAFAEKELRKIQKNVEGAIDNSTAQINSGSPSDSPQVKQAQIEEEKIPEVVPSIINELPESINGPESSNLATTDRGPPQEDRLIYTTEPSLNNLLLQKQHLQFVLNDLPNTNPVFPNPGEVIHDASLVTENNSNHTPMFHLLNNYPNPSEIPILNGQSSSNSSFEFYPSTFDNSEDFSSFYNSDPLEYPLKPRFPPSSAISRTQQKLLLQRQHFLADDENFLIHPRNQLRLTKVIERINREQSSVLLYRDPMLESLQRVFARYAQEHPEVTEEDFGASYDDTKDWDQSKGSLEQALNGDGGNATATAAAATVGVAAEKHHSK